MREERGRGVREERGVRGRGVRVKEALPPGHTYEARTPQYRVSSSFYRENL